MTADRDSHPFAIRRGADADATTLADFYIAMARETEGKRLLPEVVGAGVRRLLGEPALGFYLVAEAQGEVVGSAMVTTEWSDWRNGRFWWIQSVYVRPAWRRRGVFRALYAHIRQAAASAPDVCGFRLYVEHENRAAQATYRALGMDTTDYLLLESLRPGVRWLAADVSSTDPS
jgi:ribosomal protein S18 acetylase RimI-like enzyme